jgi:hypothetical protein
LHLRIREAEDPRAAVARPTFVSDLELLQDHDRTARAGERVRRRGPGNARADDCDLRVAGGVGAPGQWTVTARAALVAALASAW